MPAQTDSCFTGTLVKHFKLYLLTNCIEDTERFNLQFRWKNDRKVSSRWIWKYIDLCSINKLLNSHRGGYFY